MPTLISSSMQDPQIYLRNQLNETPIKVTPATLLVMKLTSDAPGGKLCAYIS